MLAGRYPSEDFAGLRPRLVWDRVTGSLRGRPGGQRIAVTNGGTIPDRGLFGVFLAGASDPTGKAYWIKNFDYFGLLLFTAGFVVFVMGLSWGGAAYPWKSAAVITAIVGGFAVLVAFVLWFG